MAAANYGRAGHKFEIPPGRNVILLDKIQAHTLTGNLETPFSLTMWFWTVGRNLSGMERE